MSDIFYYCAFLYILSEIINIIEINKKGHAEKTMGSFETLKNPPEDASDLGNFLYRAKDDFKISSLKGVAQGIRSIFFLLWLIIGIKYSEESKIFITILIVTISAIIIPIIEWIAIALKSKEFFIKALISSTSNIVHSKTIKIIFNIMAVLNIIGALFILYFHFHNAG